MTPQPFVQPGTPDNLDYCPDCTQHYWRGLGHECGARPVGKFWRGIWLALILSIPFWLGAGYLAHDAFASANVHPIKIPEARAKARAKCPTLLKCRAALIHAYDAVAWQREKNLELAREMVGKLNDWTCIHRGEGAWDSNTGNGYHGGLQMDWGFMRTYGRDMIRRHHGAGAEAWTPREQIIVAQRAYAQGRGYAPWPNTSRACGLR